MNEIVRLKHMCVKRFIALTNPWGTPKTTRCVEPFNLWIRLWIVNRSPAGEYGTTVGDVRIGAKLLASYRTRGSRTPSHDPEIYEILCPDRCGQADSFLFGLSCPYCLADTERVHLGWLCSEGIRHRSKKLSLRFHASFRTNALRKKWISPG